MSRWYPYYVFNVNENITRENMRAFDKKQEQIEKRCHTIAPNYDDLSCIEQYEIRKQARQELNYD